MPLKASRKIYDFFEINQSVKISRIFWAEARDRDEPEKHTPNSSTKEMWAKANKPLLQKSKSISTRGSSSDYSPGLVTLAVPPPAKKKTKHIPKNIMVSDIMS